MHDTPCPPEFVAAEAWKVLVRPRPVPTHAGPAMAPNEPDAAATTTGQETSFWEAAWNAK